MLLLYGGFGVRLGVVRALGLLKGLGWRQGPTVLLVLLLTLASFTPSLAKPADQTSSFTFAVTSDTREVAGPGTYDTSAYYRGVLEAIRSMGGATFMVSPGDLAPPDGMRWTIDNVLGPGFLWYPAAGNHDEESPSSMAWLRSYNYDPNGQGTPPDIVRWGPSGCPKTTYSFDYGQAHFVVLNEYCNTAGDAVTYGNVPDHLYNWLAADLAATSQPLIFVLGHEPAYPQPDADNGVLRHLGDSLDAHPANRDRFWSLLKQRGVVAYIHGHTHCYSVVKTNGVWEIDSGHARGKAGLQTAPSTFVMVHVNGDTVTYDTYRDTGKDSVYTYRDITHHGTLRGSSQPTPTATPTRTPTLASSNLLANPGFELDANGDGLPDGWSIDSHFTRSSQITRSGSYAGRHYATNNSSYTVYQSVKNLTAGTTYDVSGWVNVPPTRDALKLAVVVRWYGAGGTTVGTSTVKTYTGPTNGWEQAGARLVAPFGTTNANLRMVVSSLKATVYVDDFVFKRATP